MRTAACFTAWIQDDQGSAAGKTEAGCLSRCVTHSTEWTEWTMIERRRLRFSRARNVPRDQTAVFFAAAGAACWNSVQPRSAAPVMPLTRRSKSSGLEAWVIAIS